MQHIRDVVATEFEAVNQLIISRLESRVPLVENIGHYIVDSGGKRLRPLLALLAAGAIGPVSKAQIQLAAVIEFIHTATLLHDDVVDISSLRRGRPTANAEWGNAPSVLVGDFIYSRAFQMLVELDNMAVMELLAGTTNTIAEGEVLQLTKAGQPDTSEAEYYEVIHCKTAVLFSAAMRGAGILAEQPESLLASLDRYGEHLGTAFQLIDDILDYEGDPEQTGKNVGDDLAEGKPTLPLIIAMQRGTSEEAQLIRHAIENKDKSAIEAVIAAVVRTGALEYTREQAVKQNQMACDALSELADSPCKQALMQIAKESSARLS